jgi:hypothetical protein
VLDLVFIGLLAFCLELVDNGLGGGFGTILSPLLIILGYDPRVIVPAILFSEMVSGITGGAFHGLFRNVNYKAVGATLAGSIVAMVIASFVVGVLIPGEYIKWYIGLLAPIMGIFVIVRSYGYIKPLSDKRGFSKWKCALMGGVIGFNKGSTGGGYGPLSVSGYILLGLTPAVAIGTTTIAEGIACTIGVASYLSTIGIVLGLATALAIGSAIADPISAWFNNYMKRRLELPLHGRLVGVAMVCVGFVTVLKLAGLM